MGERSGIGWLTCTSVVIANMVGTGIFTSLGFQVAVLPSAPVILLLWVMGAGFALCGALCYAELAAALPRSGGEYNFLNYIYGREIGFMAGFVSATVGFAAPVALAAMAFGEYLHAAVPAVQPLVASTVVAIAVTGAHLVTVESSMVFQNCLTVLKLTVLATLIASGFVIGPTVEGTFATRPADAALLFTTPFAVSLMYVMYAYSGWNASTYIIGEVRNPSRDVPWSLIAGTTFVGLLYLAVNAVFLKTVPLATLSGQLDVGHLAGAAIFGPRGGRILSGFICAGLVSAISAMTWAGPRVAATIGEDFATLHFLARRTRGGIPANAVVLQLALVLGLLWTATFQSVLLYTQFALVVCGLLAVLGVIVLRVRERNLARPFRCWGYPATPLLFAATGVFTLVYTARERPWQAAAGIGTLALALAIYRAGRWMRGKSRRA
ncbi:MAG: amino acid permease [Terrimicrobiaceae bacterium]|nr:amino acid permease [Terrimicrobiaceae bacterium]